MTQQPGGSGPDLIGEFQRWLIRSSARGVSRQVTDQLRSALGRNQQQSTGDVWETATAEPPDEAPECAWCPLCRAARLLRESKAGRDTRVTAVSDALGGVVQDAFNVLEAALAATGRAAAGDGRRTGTAGTATARPGAARPGPDGKPAAKQRPGPGTAGAQRGPGDRAARTGAAAGDGTAQPPGDKTTAAQPKPADGSAKAGQVPADGTAAADDSPGAKQGTTGRGPAGHAAGAKPAPADGPADGHGTTDRGPGAEPGTAGQGRGEEPAVQPPGESLHEPDDRG